MPSFGPMSLSLEFSHELRRHFRGDIRLDFASRVLYSTDASIYQIEPLGVVLPQDQDDLQAVVELAGKYLVPILPRGSGSSLAGQAIGPALILDCSRWLNKLIRIDPEAQVAVAEPGLVLSRLNKVAGKHGLMFGPDPASAERATIGGVIGNNATGAHSMRYGMTADHLVSAQVLYTDGSTAEWGSDQPVTQEAAANSRHEEILRVAQRIRENYSEEIRKSYPLTWRNSAGYRLNYLLPWSKTAPAQWDAGPYPRVPNNDSINLVSLLAGSEGTLAVIKNATLRLVPEPRHTVLGVLAYTSIAEACDDVPRLLEFSPSAVELVPQMLIRLARDVPAYAAQMGWVVGDPAALLVVEFSGDQPQHLLERARSIGHDVQIAETEERQRMVWNVRKVGLGIFDSQPADARPVAFMEDCALPVEKLGEFVREVELILNEHQTTAAFYAHASAGCLHIRPILNLKSGQGRQALRIIAEATFALVVRLGGAMSSEHGDGIARGEFLRQTYGDGVLEAMRLVKQAVDPDNLLNPGKMLEAPALDSNLRFHTEYRAQAWTPALDFSRNNFLAGAIEQCNGQGVCRKDGGVMCPSFQATREEANSTRGRANLLRTFINSQHDTSGKLLELEQAAFDALALCLACKGCKSECPSGVDMAKLKYEFQHEYYKKHPRHLRDYLFAYIGSITRAGAFVGGIINWLSGLPVFRSIFHPLFHISIERQLPTFASRHCEHHAPISEELTLEKVLLLRDTFTHFFEPDIECAVLDTLAACGVGVVEIPGEGAGRTMLSKGFIESARRQAVKMLDQIERLDPEAVLPVLGIEPSELYTMRDEWLDLLPGRAEQIDALARRAWLVEEFLVRPGLEGKPRALRIASIADQGNRFTEEKPKILLHGHCYQKVQPPAWDGLPVGQEASAELMRVLGYDVDLIPSGCCGMAGAFGYEEEHQQLSMQVGELALFPAVRAGVLDGASISAVGTSCRSQIEDGTGVKAEHPLVLVHALLHNKVEGASGVRQ
jgi:FAD/FMN-containing dehydrogenase/Fe-S oxidoreductase